ncbi:MAG TPA: acyl-CoA dehydrogenase [Sulfolobales archaeon]|nr:acyl-CoA dehydrogenase [Sulfolobales archaeon]
MALGPVYELAIENLEVPAENLVGEEGKGFRHLLGALNAERIVIAGELVGATRYLIRRTVEYASKRIVFGKPIGSYQGVQFPISSTYIELLAADEILHRAAKLYDEGAESRVVGLYSNAAKYYATEVAWKAANTAMDTFGGYGYAWETGIERKLREIRLYRVAPVNQNLILAYIGHSILGLPRSYEP